MSAHEYEMSFVAWTKRPQERKNAISEPLAPFVAESFAGKIPDPLVFTDNAANKVKSLIDEEGNPDLKLRVFVTGGGGSGFQCGFTFAETVSDDDTALSKAGVTRLVDAMSLQYLLGASPQSTATAQRAKHENARLE